MSRNHFSSTYSRRMSTPWRTHISSVGLPHARRPHSFYDRTGKHRIPSARRDYVDPVGLARLRRRMNLRNELNPRQQHMMHRNIDDAMVSQMSDSSACAVRRYNTVRPHSYF